jgi:hypothetical protein
MLRESVKRSSERPWRVRQDPGFRATKLRPGKARSDHRYVNDAVRFFAAQCGLT